MNSNQLNPHRVQCFTKSLRTFTGSNHRGGYYALLKRGGKQIRRSLKTKDPALARRRLNEMRDKVSRLNTNTGASKITFDELTSRRYENHRIRLKEKSMSQLDTCIIGMRPYFGSVPVRNITAHHCEAWIGKRGKEISASSYKHERRVLLAILDFAVRDGLLLGNPSRDSVPIRKIAKTKPVIPTREQFALLVGTIRQADVRAKPAADLVELLGVSGMRLFPGKHSGMIVDYANVFASLEKALAIYGAGKAGKNPVRDKQKLVADLRKAVEQATAFCPARQVILPAIEQLTVGSLERLQRVADAVDALISPDPIRREFIGHERIVKTLYTAVKPDPAALEFAARVSTLTAIADAIRAKLNPNPADISAVMGNIAKLLDASITGADIPSKPAPLMDLSKIDFEALRRRFKESKHKNTDLEILKAAIRAQLEKLIRLNKTRADFAEKFEELIESYNNGSRNIEELFNELLRLSRSLSDEQQRHVREHVTEEELVVFDILTRPAPELSAEERSEVKKVARELLNKLKQLLVINWRQKSSARSQVKLAIEDVLDTGLPRAYSPELYKQKCSALFEHVYENYTERDVSTYAA